MKEAMNFQKAFFDYQLPVPWSSIYSEEFVRSNDIRLLLEIATRSSLRMYTDGKTGNLHFICKQKGSNCLDIQAEPHSTQKGYYFPVNYSQIKHRDNCELSNQPFQYLRIYNLMKLKKRLIEEFMIKLKIQKESPSVILSKMSNHHEVYFYQKYIDGHLQYKRKLRKRFDNIVNIDIKKIGKPDDIQEVQVKKIPPKKSMIRRHRMKHRARLAKLKLLQKRSNQKLVQSKQKNNEQSQSRIVFIKNKLAKNKSKSKIKKDSKKQKKAKKSESVIIENQGDKDLLDSKNNLIEDNNEKVYEQGDKQQEENQKILPEIMVLNQQAEYIWSESEESDSPSVVAEVHIITNCEDYFRSLRNSALKQSLQRQSLNFCFFSSESKSSNKQNTQ